MASISPSLPMVTIGVPTYKRPELLQRALQCVAAQDYPNIELIVADNDTPGDEVTRIVEGFRSRIQGLVFIKHPSNIGAFANFFSILHIARGKYFMWLADDDEISSNYVSGLAAVLESNPDAVSAAAHWITVLDDGGTWPRDTMSFPQHSALTRCVRFIWRTDDAFFYALHRTDTLRTASFPGYWWPNRDVLLNWGYVYLLDMVLRGRVLLAPESSVQFFNDNSAPKLYLEHGRGAIETFRFCVRRLNVHWLYLRKSTRFIGIWTLPLLAIVSLGALTREIATYLGEAIRAKLKRPAVAGQRS